MADPHRACRAVVEGDLISKVQHFEGQGPAVGWIGMYHSKETIILDIMIYFSFLFPRK